MTPSPEPLGVIAGSGRLPVLFAEEAKKQGSPRGGGGGGGVALSRPARAAGDSRLGLTALAALLLSCAACRREPPKETRALAPDPHETAPWDPQKFKPEQRASVELLNKMRHPDWLQQRNDRRMLVLPAPAGFNPEPADRKLKLTLRLREDRIRRGAKLGYRLELQNVGRKGFFFNETDSFFKGNVYIGWGEVNLILTLPDASTQTLKFTPRLVSATGGEVRLPGQERWSRKESDAIVADLNDYLRRFRGLAVTLHPGETLYSRPWSKVDGVEEFFRTHGGEVPPEPAPLEFKDLLTDFRFNAPGRYRIQAVLDRSGPRMPNEEHIAAMERKGFKRQELLADYRKQNAEALGVLRSEEVPFAVSR